MKMRQALNVLLCFVSMLIFVWSVAYDIEALFYVLHKLMVLVLQFCIYICIYILLVLVLLRSCRHEPV
jgi:hypothetical protein